MRKLQITLLALLLSATSALAQFARVQIIHNSPDPTVDIYVNGGLLLDDFAFRTAQPFIDVPGGIPLSIAVAPASSMSVADAIATFDVTFDVGKTYVVTASGVVGDPNTPFGLLVDDNGREAALQSNKVDVSVLHGSPDAPAVDVVVRTGGKLVSNISYGEFTSYLSLDPGEYFLDIKPAGSDAIVGTYRADLTALSGAALKVMASGFLNGDPSFGLYAVLADGTVVGLPLDPVARVQFIHNVPGVAVDVYKKGSKFFENVTYRTAKEFLFVPADQLIDIGIAPAGSASVDDTIANFNYTFENGKTYYVTASGIVGDPNTPLTLFFNDAAREAANDTNKVEIAVLHGSPNAPAVDVDAVFVANNVIENLAYGESSGYLTLDTAKYDFAIRATGDPNVVASFRADLSALKGAAAYVFASGLLGGDPSFGLFAALPNGDVVELPLTPTARLQVIHNSPSPTVDVYAGNTRLLADFEFRTATPYVTIPADRDINIGVAPAGSASADDAIFNVDISLPEGGVFAAFASGIVGDPNTPFTILADVSREAANDPAAVEFNIHHGSPNAPAVDIAVVGLGDIATNVAYGDFTSYFEVFPGPYQIQIKPAGSDDVLVTYDVDLTGLDGAAARVFASGLFGGDPAFGLFAALADGTVVEFPAVAVPATARVQLIHNSPEPTVDVYVNGELALDDFEFRTATEFDDAPANELLTISIAPGNSNSVADAIAEFDVTFEEGKTYVVVASGIVGDPNTPFALIVNDLGREEATDPNNVDIAILHGSPDAPAVDVDAVFVADDVVSNLGYGEFTDYLELAPDKYDFAIRAAGDPNVVASYRADLSGLAGAAAVVFASGLLGGDPSFGLFAALPDGDVIELPLTPTARLQVIHNSPSPTVDVYAGNTRLLEDFEFRTATPYVTIPADRNINIGVAPAGSASAADAIFNVDISLPEGGVFAAFASGIVGDPITPFEILADESREASLDPNAVEFNIHHGSPNAPPVDVAVVGLGNVATGLFYGDFSAYLSVPGAPYQVQIKPFGSDDVLATYDVDLTGLDGAAARVFASGLFGGDPAFGLFAALADGTVIEFPVVASPATARVQLIHNSPEPTVDVYINGELALDDFEFRTATEFDDAPANELLKISIAPGNSNSVDDAIAEFDVTFEEGKTYIVVASGIVGSPTTPFELIVNDMGREEAIDDSKLELAILHGAPDAPAVNITPFGAPTPLLSNISYKQFVDYVTLDPAIYLLDITPTANPAVRVGTYGGDFTQLGGLVGVVFASGLLNGDPGFELWIALPDGSTFPLPAFSPVQVIHNSPSPVVDVYYDDILVLDDFAFRQATNFGLFPADAPFTLAVAPGNSSSVNDAIYTLDVDGLNTRQAYVIVAAGVVGNATTPFQLYINDQARLRSLGGANSVDVALFHGAPDAPEVDVQVQGGPVVFDNVSFGEFADYISVPPAAYILELTPADDNSQIIQSYLANLLSLDGEAVTVFASGFIVGQPGFEVWVARSNGVTFPLPVFISTNDLDNKLERLALSPNPAVDRVMAGFKLNDNISLRYAVRDLTGRMVMEGEFGPRNAGEYAEDIDVSGIPTGMYLFELRSEQGVQVRKFAVQR